MLDLTGTDVDDTSDLPFAGHIEHIPQSLEIHQPGCIAASPVATPFATEHGRVDDRIHAVDGGIHLVVVADVAVHDLTC